MNVEAKISSIVAEEIDYAIELRRFLHKHPELAFQENVTCAKVVGELEDFGYECQELADTGIVTTLDTGKAGPTILLRADMDGLPVREESDIEWKSVNDGCMHACGHDAHMAILVTVASILKKNPPQKGKIVFVFQPAEEGGSGAQRMLEEGLNLDGVDHALAFHVWSPFPAGTIGIVEGAAMASVDRFTAVVSGKGTHAAVPEGGIDPVVISAQIISAAQTLISRRTSPQKSAVLSFTSIHGGTTHNVIPPSVELMGTIRSLDDSVRQRVKEELVELGKSVAKAMNGTFDLEYIGGLPVLKNSPEFCSLVRKCAQAIVEDSQILRADPLLVGEDMALFLDRIPGAMIFIGCGNDGLAAFPHHHPSFNVDEEALGIGIELALQVVKQLTE